MELEHSVHQNLGGAAAVAAPHARVGASAPRFYVVMAAMYLAIAVAGFSPTFWVPMMRGTLHVPPITYVHALFFYGWVVLFLVQTALAASGNLRFHRELGVFGVAVATGMCFAATGLLINSLKRFEAAGMGAAERPIAIVSAAGVVVISTVFAAAMLNVKRPEVHKRLMLALTSFLLQAAIGRLIAFFLVADVRTAQLGSPPPVAVTLFASVPTDLLLIIPMIYDRLTRGRVHPAYWLASAYILAVQVAIIPLSRTHAWLRVTDWLIALSP